MAQVEYPSSFFKNICKMNCLTPLLSHGKGCPWCMDGSTSRSPGTSKNHTGTSKMCSCMICTSGYSCPGQKLGSIRLSNRQDTSGWPCYPPRWSLVHRLQRGLGAGLHINNIITLPCSFRVEQSKRKPQAWK